MKTQCGSPVLGGGGSPLPGGWLNYCPPPCEPSQNPLISYPGQILRRVEEASDRPNSFVDTHLRKSMLKAAMTLPQVPCALFRGLIHRTAWGFIC